MLFVLTYGDGRGHVSPLATPRRVTSVLPSRTSKLPCLSGDQPIPGLTRSRSKRDCVHNVHTIGGLQRGTQVLSTGHVGIVGRCRSPKLN